jgi:hypothetical protein
MEFQVANQMEPFPFTEEEWSEVGSATLAVTNATLADDHVLRDSAYLDLEDVIHKLCKKYGDHPVLLETLADFESDPALRIRQYQHAIRQAEQFELPTVTIRLALATDLIEEFGSSSEARRELMECKSELAGHDDKSDIETWSRVMRKCEQPRADYYPSPEGR